MRRLLALTLFTAACNGSGAAATETDPTTTTGETTATTDTDATSTGALTTTAPTTTTADTSTSDDTTGAGADVPAAPAARSCLSRKTRRFRGRGRSARAL
ncbi:hypothetical protein [Nannocystis pusilla]|uniref:hypothetical protein n=1 Tax=Nannocystis pusilla TaxID=889268 RepID=UPI003B7DECF6